MIYIPYLLISRALGLSLFRRWRGGTNCREMKDEYATSAELAGKAAPFSRPDDDKLSRAMRAAKTKLHYDGRARRCWALIFTIAAPRARHDAAHGSRRLATFRPRWR